MNEPAGWYHAKGDPAGTTRYWTGSEWEGEAHEAPQMESEAKSLAVVSPGVRFAARLVDWLLLSIVLAPAISAGQSDSGSTVLGMSNGWLAVLGVGLFFWDTIWTGVFGATPGKLIFGFRVLDAKSHAMPPGLMPAVVRAAHRLLLILPVIGELIWLWIGAVSVGMILTGKTKQSVMDRLARTIVAALPGGSTNVST